MLLKTIVALVVLGALVSIPKPESLADDGVSITTLVSEASVQMPDTIAYPSLRALELYLEETFPSEDNADYSTLSWDSFTEVKPLELYPVGLNDWQDENGEFIKYDGIGVKSIQVYQVKYESYRLYVVRDLIDEDLLEEPVGLHGAVVYELWGEAS